MACYVMVFHLGTLQKAKKSHLHIYSHISIRENVFIITGRFVYGTAIIHKSFDDSFSPVCKIAEDTKISRIVHLLKCKVYIIFE